MRLRAHHLVCLHFFKGEGYTPEYVENLKNLMKKVRGEKIEVILGADDVCKPCPFLNDDVCGKGEESIAELDFLAMKLLEIKPGDLVEWEQTEKRLPEIIGIWKKYACFDCEYKSICSQNEKWQD